MKTTAEFIERLRNDEAFSQEISDKVRKEMEGDNKDYKQVIVSVASEYDYEVDPDMLDTVDPDSDVLSEEELGKVAGGTLPVIVISGSMLSICIITEVIESIIKD